ncbi:MAG: hypothetical protein ACTJHC_08700, partial [Vagococcus sp.]
MFFEDVNIDVQIYQEEVKKPSESSIILMPSKQQGAQINQLLLKWTDSEGVLTQKDIDQVGQSLFQEWESTFPLYQLERAFVDMTGYHTIELYMTFDASTVFSNTQIRNIKKNSPELLKKELQKVTEHAEAGDRKQVAKTESNQLTNRVSLLQQQLTDTEQSQHRIERDLQDKLNAMKRENSDLQMKLQQSKADELSQKEKLGRLTVLVEKQQRTLDDLSNGSNQVKNEYDERYRQLKDENDDLNYQLRKSNTELLDKQRDIQQLEQTISQHDRYVQTLQVDLDRAKQSNDVQLNQLMAENEALKADVIRYQNNELAAQKSVQGTQTELLALKNDITQLHLERDNRQEEMQQKYQRAQFENEELRAVLKENQTFEDQTQHELVEVTRELGAKRERVKQLETENQLLAHEWESRYQHIQSERDELTVLLDNTRQLDVERQNELMQLNDRLSTQEQTMRQAVLETERMTSKWQERLALLEVENKRLVQQSEIEKEQIARSKQNEIKHLSDRLTQQQELVSKMVASQKDTQSSWQDNYKQLEKNYQQARQQTANYEQELLVLKQKNQTLEAKLSHLEQLDKVSSDVSDLDQPLGIPASAFAHAVIPELTTVEDNQLMDDIDREVEELTVPVVDTPAAISEDVEEPIPNISYEDESSEDEYGYNEDDDDYDYDYEDD